MRRDDTLDIDVTRSGNGVKATLTNPRDEGANTFDSPWVTGHTIDVAFREGQPHTRLIDHQPHTAEVTTAVRTIRERSKMKSSTGGDRNVSRHDESMLPPGDRKLQR